MWRGDANRVLYQIGSYGVRSKGHMSAESEHGQNQWYTTSELWQKLKPLAREKRGSPTPAEDRLWQRLRNRQVCGAKFRRQYSIDRFIVDFFAVKQKLAIEVDGSIHDYTSEEDAIRQEFIESLGIQVLRFSNEEVFENIEDVLGHIADILGKKA
jgi:very-short-patch-repair endonuclease